ncbi:ABC transporter permease [Paenibacillus alkaliterrae]|uniref:ABC transporter permease n=1 Tax=Paenibacillus alkaliterrae TaxID=320909 RepID=UPI001F3054D5|nr:ABC transporter permease [Paenibacillus alkaliterrae]MCF2936855.1 ABC transporter permease [Paenibacillus alkaliterrae]
MASIPIAVHLIKRTMGTRRGLIMNVLLPALLLSVMAGLFSGLQGNKAVIVINNTDTGLLGSSLVTSLEKETQYEVRLTKDMTEQALKAQVLDGDADASIHIPHDYTQKMIDGEQSNAVLYRMDEQLWNASLAAMLNTEADKLAASVRLVQNKGAQTVDSDKLAALLAAQAFPKAAAESVGMRLGNIVSNPMMIGLILMFVMMLLSQSIGLVMEDREQRTMARMYTAPLRSLDIAFGNFAGSMIVATIQLVIVLGLTYFAFGYSPGIPFGSMLIVLEFYLLAALGLVSAIAGLVRNSTQLSQINNLIITPTCMISGCFFPLSMLPDFLQRLANFTPQKWALQAIDRLGGGGSFSDIGLHLLILFLFAAVMLAFGSAVLRPNKTS